MGIHFQPKIEADFFFSNRANTAKKQCHVEAADTTFFFCKLFYQIGMGKGR